MHGCGCDIAAIRKCSLMEDDLTVSCVCVHIIITLLPFERFTKGCGLDCFVCNCVCMIVRMLPLRRRSLIDMNLTVLCVYICVIDYKIAAKQLCLVLVIEMCKTNANRIDKDCCLIVSEIGYRFV